MHRLLMTSSTYRQSSQVRDAVEDARDGDVAYSRMPLTRLDAEALYDTMLLVAGRLDETRFGPSDAVQVRADGLATPAGSDRGWRRLIYVRQARKIVPTHLENFDYPQMNPNCLERRDSTVAPQALHLLNNGMVLQLSEQFARRVMREAGADHRRQIEQVYLIALSRMPNAEEKKLGLDALALLADQWAAKSGKETAELKALTTYCHSLVNSAGFLYVD